eukprot:1144572-Pelagomonas_calceolata.AAC.1
MDSLLLPSSVEHPSEYWCVFFIPGHVSAMQALKQHNSSNRSKVSIRQWCSSPTSNQPISMQPKLSRVLACSPPFTPLFGAPSENRTRVSFVAGTYSTTKRLVLHSLPSSEAAFRLSHFMGTVFSYEVVSHRYTPEEAHGLHFEPFFGILTGRIALLCVRKANVQIQDASALCVEADGTCLNGKKAYHQPGRSHPGFYVQFICHACPWALPVYHYHSLTLSWEQSL